MNIKNLKWMVLFLPFLWTTLLIHIPEEANTTPLMLIWLLHKNFRTQTSDDIKGLFQTPYVALYMGVLQLLIFIESWLKPLTYSWIKHCIPNKSFKKWLQGKVSSGPKLKINTPFRFYKNFLLRISKTKGIISYYVKMGRNI